MRLDDAHGDGIAEPLRDPHGLLETGRDRIAACRGL
jgi:hypothetical protein